MRLLNAEVFVDGEFKALTIEIEGNSISSIGNTTSTDGIDCTGCIIIPGMIDMHSHGCKGYDFSTASEEEMDVMCDHYAKNGITAVAATGMTLGLDTLKECYTRIRNKIEEGTTGAKIVGINMEGPYLSAGKKGAHDAQYLAKPTLEHFEQIREASGDHIVIVDLSPTEDGAMDFIKEVSKTTAVSIAHTGATYDVAMQAIAAGATNITHLFNAMAPFAHREPGVIGAAFDSGVTAELICDGIHLHPAVIRTAFKVLGKRAVLVSDSMCAAGMPDGDYVLGGLAVTVNNRKATLTADGTIAGSTITAYEGMRNAVKFGVPLELAVNAVTEAPARALRIDDCFGKIAEGRKADLVILDKSTLEIRSVIIEGVTYA